ncbi:MULTISPECIES: SAM-dependent methyltransferase [Shewanella]|uniref:SAM-dependent methyltransferase n=1 Tax=Shewanella TaxID=22 RepID=UPI00200C264D|nr:SAM-dependent methyltransferase [Shewanella basaltis]MCL1112485.1 SAM-dependent methyltransferase [Shewanella basaltis]
MTLQPQHSSINMTRKGQLICVGTGIQLAGQIGELSVSYIRLADVVFSLVPDGFTERWLASLNDDVRSLQVYYAQADEIKNRRETYQQMVDAILTEVNANKIVVCALYGHPGVFSCVSHMAIEQARLQGFKAKMLAGVSAEACLWADLGIDPGRCGHQSYEATQFMLYQHQPDTSAHVVLWQIALAGEHTLTQFCTTKAKIQILVEHLSQWYNPTHKVVIYEAANLAVQTPRIEWITLAELVNVPLTTISTLLIPPSKALTLNNKMLARLAITEADLG